MGQPLSAPGRLTRIFLLRHGATAWNGEHRIQGATDIGITDATRSSLRRLQIPPCWLAVPWYTSPLIRCRETAALLGADHVESAEPLREMHWGSFEGLTLDEVNAEIRRLDLQPARGMDLLPPGGESPRMVRQRFARWLDTLSTQAPAIVAVTHKGVIRAALSLATGWDLMSPFPRAIDWQLPLCFESHGGNDFRLLRVNCRWRDTSLLALGGGR